MHAPYRHLWPVRLYNIFPLYLTNGMIFDKKNIEYEVCVFSLQIFNETFLIIRQVPRYITIIYIGFHVKYPLLLSDFNGIWILFGIFFSKNAQISNNMKIRPVVAELFHADWRTDGHRDMTNQESLFAIW
jgi:hypothetical protein